MKVTITFTPDSMAIAMIAWSMDWMYGSFNPRKVAAEMSRRAAPMRYARIDRGCVHW
jgi:NADH:ubiquinone oxidoreductase subunit H